MIGTDREFESAVMLRRIDAEEVDVSSGIDLYPDLQEIYEYWKRKAAGNWAPLKADIDPIDIPRILPRVMLCDVFYKPDTEEVESFRYRLSGTGICDVHGFDPTALQPPDLTPPEYGALIQSHYEEAVTRREPMVHIIVLESIDKVRSYARIILPLSRDGNRVDVLMTIDSEKQNTLSDFLDDMDRARTDRL